MMKLLCGFVALSVASILFSLSPKHARASGVVGTGTPDTCTEAALDTALAGGGNVTFKCGASPYTLTVATTKRIAANTKLDGGGLITLSGGGAVGIFFVNARVTMVVANVTFTGGYSSLGGAIYNSGRLTVANSTFSNNSALGPGFGAGGAIANWGNKPKLTVTNSTFSNNSANDSGGAVVNWNTGTVTLTNSTFTNNSAASSDGGAISNAHNTKLSVTNCSFTNNRAELQGGAISGAGVGLAVRVINSTFANNSTADSYGGAIFASFSARVSIIDSTFANNSAFEGGGAVINWYNSSLTVTDSTFADNSATGYGGGAILTIDAAPRMKNTIVANSTAGGNCSGKVVDGGHNIDSDGTCGLLTSRGSLSGVDPELDPAGLADNGGPTQTIAVEGGSPAINLAPCSETTDQRGYLRRGTSATHCTTGAYEFNSPGCPLRLTSCGAMSICTNLRIDPLNCGACGNACALGRRCSGGVCR